MDPVKQAPPRKQIGKFDWYEVAQMCQANPEEWFFVNNKMGKVPHSTYGALLRGKMAAIDPYFYEIRAANTEWTDKPRGRSCDLYIRYMPNKNTRYALNRKKKK